MPRRLRAGDLDHVFDRIRAEEELPLEFPPAALLEAEEGAPGTSHHEDLTELPFVTIDPPEALDLDQAIHLEAVRRGGVRVRYAIADVALFVGPGGAIDQESHRRGLTVYCPDIQVRLHPRALSEGSASLLPGADRPAVVWEMEVDADGSLVHQDVRRAIVRSRARFDYRTVQDLFDHGRPPEPLAPLRRFGEARLARARERGAIALRLPEQTVIRAGAKWSLVNRAEPAAELWNAELSLLTGMVAAEMMLDAGVGVLRTLPAPSEEAVASLRRSTRALGINWSADEAPGEILAGLDPSRPRQLAVFEHAATLLRGAGYRSFSGGRPEGDTGHGGVAANYAHVTAPLRRLVDRYAAEVCLAVSAGSEVPEWVTARLEVVPEVMAQADRRAATVERRCLDTVEAHVMEGRVGETFQAVVLEARPDRAEVWIDHPPVLTWADAPGLGPGDTVALRLAAVDVAEGRIELVPAG